MKPYPSISHARARAGIILVECLVYLGVFAVLLGIGYGTFYVCWDYSKALHYATDDITSALRAGERWRADIRNATGKITVETTAQGEQLRIPRRTTAIIYSFKAGELHRQFASSRSSELVLPTVKASQMVKETRGPVTAWRWELEVTSRRKETHLPLLFTFEAAAKTTP
ncbi:MAG: hypothetical protein WBN75_06750 [Verrucomicrobiia bacterium]